MKHRLVLWGLILVLVISSTGCLGKGTRWRNSLEELELSSLFSEEEGYHFAPVEWGMDDAAFQKATENALTSVGGYGAHNISIYNADGLGVRLQGRVCDGATAAFDEDNICYMVTFIFRESQYSTSTVTLKELSASYYEKLCDTFGEPDEVLEDTSTSNNITMHYKEYYWNHTRPDGKITQLQWAKAYTVDEKDPTMLSLGVICLTDKLREQMAADETKTEE